MFPFREQSLYTELMRQINAWHDECRNNTYKKTRYLTCMPQTSKGEITGKSEGDIGPICFQYFSLHWY